MGDINFFMSLSALHKVLFKAAAIYAVRRCIAQSS